MVVNLAIARKGNRIKRNTSISTTDNCGYRVLNTMNTEKVNMIGSSVMRIS